MHSSRMRTARLLTISQHALRRGECVYPGTPLGPEVDTLPVDRMIGVKT